MEVVFEGRDSRSWIRACCYSPDGKTFALASTDNKVYLYDSKSFALKAKVSTCRFSGVAAKTTSDSGFRSLCRHTRRVLNCRSYMYTEVRINRVAVPAKLPSLVRTIHYVIDQGARCHPPVFSVPSLQYHGREHIDNVLQRSLSLLGNVYTFYCRTTCSGEQHNHHK